MIPGRLPPLGLACALIALACALAFGTRAAAPAAAMAATAAQPPAVNLDLKDFGAVGDGVSDDGPALQAAFDALAAGGGGTLFVPEGRYLIATPVVKNFAGSASSVSVRGVASDTTVRNDVPGHELAASLELVSEFIPAVGSGAYAIDVKGLDSFLVEHISFYGRPGVFPDADVTLLLTDVTNATIRHCEFYSVSSLSAAVVYARRTGLSIEQTKFLGCAGSSGIRVPVVENVDWKGVSVSDTVFIDYGLRPEQFNKTSAAVPYSWVNVGPAAPATNLSPRREVLVRNVFLDEGQIFGISVTPHFHTPATPADLVYVTDLRMNVSKLGSVGLYLVYPKRTLVENSHFGWSDNADAAISVIGGGAAVLDRVECVDHAYRIRADAGTGRLTVIDSIYTHLDSLAAVTRVITTSAPDEDPVQYVRAQFEAVLGREPDAAAHSYWPEQILNCGADAQCVAARRAALAAYLASSPQPDFDIDGLITDEDGQPVAGVAVALTGSHTLTTTTDAAGLFRFAGLQTSGVYTLHASKRHYTFDTPKVITTPAGDVRADVSATLNRHAVRGRLTDLGGAGIGGAAVTLSGSQTAATTTDSSGNFSFTSLPAGGGYTVAASSARHTFDPASLSFADLDADRAADFTGTPLFHTISGRLSKPDNSAMPGVTVKLTGARAATATTDAQGNYSFPDLPRGGGYTVTPGPALGFTFAPASQSFANVTADKSADFAGVLTEYMIAGRVTEGGAGLAGVAVTLTGSRAGAATTDSSGNYSLSVPANGSYTVTPSKAHYTFAPASAVLNAVTADRTADFAATLNRHKISGRVRRSGGAGMSNITVTLSGSQAGTAITDAQGNYSFMNLPAGRSYTVTPSRPGYDFAPTGKTFDDLGADQTGDFTVTPSNINIAGRVTSGGAALASVTMTLSGAKSETTTTDAAGNYSFTVTSEGNYLVTPSKRHYTFAPLNAGYTNPLANRVADFAATINRHKISGRVTKSGGVALQGATVTLSGSQTLTTTTDAQGNYSFPNLPAGGNYTVAVARANYSFTSTSQTFNDLDGDRSADFAGALVSYRVAGRVTSGGAGLGGVTVALSGSQTGAATTDAQGNYSFTLTAEGGYTFTPSKKHYTFAPASTTFASLDGDKAADFAATLNRHAIRGRAADTSGRALAGVAVTLSGSQTAATTTDSSGNFSFTNLPAGGGYTVAASSARHTFDPASLSFADLDADRAADFTGTPLFHTISGRLSKPDNSAMPGVTVKLTGARAATATTDAQGNYSFVDVPRGGGYTVTPGPALGYTFAPASASFADLDGDRVANFTGTPLFHTITGRLARADNSGMAGVAVKLSGTLTATATTDAQGNYSFVDLPRGGSYAVTPSLEHHAFSPASQSFNDLDGDRTASFVGSLLSHRLSGRVTEKGVGLAGVTIDLAGAHPLLGVQAAQALTAADGTYSLAVAAGGAYTLKPSKKNYVFDPASASFAAVGGDRAADFAAAQQTVVEFSAATFDASEGAGSYTVTVTRSGDTSVEAVVTYTADDGTAQQGHDLSTVVGLVTFGPGETTKTIVLFITDDGFVEESESVTLRLDAGGGVVVGERATATLTIRDNDAGAPSANPIDDAEFFVRQHYRDFLHREPDEEGLAFWVGPIARCGADAACVSAERQNVSAAFFLSIEFQETGYLVYRAYKAAYGRMPRRVGEFLFDSQIVGGGVVVNAPGWEQKLEENKMIFFERFVARDAFGSEYPTTLTPAKFVEALNVKAGGALSGEDLTAAVAEFGADADTADTVARARALRRVAESQDLHERERNPAFVLMQYFGYLKRNPDEAPDTDLTGYNNWLDKLNRFGGDYQKAEMVRAFIESIEFRGRFGR